MEVTINYNGQAVTVGVTLESMNFLTGSITKRRTCSMNSDGIGMAGSLTSTSLPPRGVGAYGETPEEYLCRVETLHELMAVLDTCTEA